MRGSIRNARTGGGPVRARGEVPVTWAVGSVKARACLFAAGSSPSRGLDRTGQRYYIRRRRRTDGTAPGGAG